jgi:hypothetical protein
VPEVGPLGRPGDLGARRQGHGLDGRRLPEHQQVGRRRGRSRPEQYNQLLTMHGSIRLLLFATPLVFGFANLVLPLRIGAPDVAFPRLNSFLSGYCAEQPRTRSPDRLSLRSARTR